MNPFFIDTSELSNCSFIFSNHHIDFSNRGDGFSCARSDKLRLFCNHFSSLFNLLNQLKTCVVINTYHCILLTKMSYIVSVKIEFHRNFTITCYLLWTGCILTECRGSVLCWRSCHFPVGNPVRLIVSHTLLFLEIDTSERMMLWRYSNKVILYIHQLTPWFLIYSSWNSRN